MSAFAPGMHEPASARVCIEALPAELPSDEPEMESTLHLLQLFSLLQSLDLFWKDRTDYFAAGNLTIFYSQRQLKPEHFRGPDFFVVLGTEKRPRKSWTVWQEDGKYPNVIVEVLSDSTHTMDRGLKKQIYQDVFRTPDYFWFDPESLEFAGFRLHDARYEPIAPDASGRLWSAQLGLFLGMHEGKLRFFTSAGALLPAGEELAAQAQEDRQRAESAEQRAGHAEQRAGHAEQRAELLARKLRALGIDPDA